MELIEKLKPDFTFSDERGDLTQLVRRGYSQVNVITSHKGVFRGGHFHRLNTEAFYVVKGCCVVTARKDGKEQRERFSQGDFFRIPPCVIHDFDYPEDCLLVSMYSLGVELDGGAMDMYTPNEEAEA